MVENLNKEDDESPNIRMTPTGDDSFGWWPDLSDLDRLNILSHPAEERARILSAKASLNIEQTMEEISERTKIPLVDEIKLPENPTKLIPLRLIHNFSCLPTLNSSDEKLELVTAWPQRIV